MPDTTRYFILENLNLKTSEQYFEYVLQSWIVIPSKLYNVIIFKLNYAKIAVKHLNVSVVWDAK